MTALTKSRMTADEFIAWAMQQPEGERYELVAGEVVAMAPERVSHTRIKHLAWLRLREALRALGLPCEAFGDGMSVRVDETTVYEPDGLVRCGEPVDDDAIEIDDPIIVVEVVSPSSRARDAGAKLADYFRLPSVRHYLIIKSESRTVIHHGRTEDGRIETHVVRSGALHLDPPGITVDVETFFEG
jgi:Uma2 family endonuclease